MSLRPLADSDLAMVLAWRNAPEVRAWMYTQHVIGMDEHRAWFERTESDPNVRWYVHEWEGVPDGVVGFTQYQPAHRNAHWGFYTAPGTRRGAGARLGIEALDLAFGALELHKLNAEALAFNARSISFHQKLGFVEEGRFRDQYHNGEKFIDIIRLGILASDWGTHRARLTA